MDKKDRSVENLFRRPGNDLQTNYEKHDIGHAHLLERLPKWCQAEEWGIDMREDGGEDGIIYDDKMDFKIRDVEDGTLLALVDVKTKSNPRYMGRFNARHYDHYVEHAESHDAPAFVVMYQVDSDSEEVYDGFVYDVSPGSVLRSSETDAVDEFPDGNEAVLVPHDERRDVSHLDTAMIIHQEAKRREE